MSHIILEDIEDNATYIHIIFEEKEKKRNIHVKSRRQEEDFTRKFGSTDIVHYLPTISTRRK